MGMDPVEQYQAAYLKAAFATSGHVSFQTSCALWGYATRAGGVNSVSGCRFDAATMPEQVDEILKTYQRVGEPANWFFGPSATPGLAVHLRKQRRLMGPRYLPGMLLDLKSWTPVVDRPEVSSLKIETWDSTFPGLVWTPKASRPDYLAWLEELSGQADFHGFGAYCEGVFAGSCLVFIDSGIAGISAVITREEYRNRGVATVAMSAAMAYARERGAEVAVLQSHKRAAGLYERLGFREIGMFTSMYYSQTRSAADALSL